MRGTGRVVWGSGALPGSLAVHQGIENGAGAPVQACCAGPKPREALSAGTLGGGRSRAYLGALWRARSGRLCGRGQWGKTRLWA